MAQPRSGRRLCWLGCASLPRCGPGPARAAIWRCGTLAAPWLALARRGGRCRTQTVGLVSRWPLLHPRSTEDAQRIPGIGPACAALVDDAFRRLRAASSRTRQPRAPPAASPNPPTAGKRKRKASNDTLPLCRYCTAAGGAGCYQKNPDHMAKFTHA